VSHESAPDENSIGNASEISNVLGAPISALRDRYAIAGDAREKPRCESSIDRERLEVAVVGPHDGALVKKPSLDLGVRVTLEKRGERVVGAGGNELVELASGETPEDEEDSSSSEPRGLPHLRGIDDEVLHQDRDSDRSRSESEMVVRASEAGWLGEDAYRGGSRGRVAPHLLFEIGLGDGAQARASPLELRDDVELLLSSEDGFERGAGGLPLGLPEGNPPRPLPRASYQIFDHARPSSEASLFVVST